MLVVMEGKYTGIIQGKEGFVTLKINQGYGSALPARHEFYICDPTSEYPYKLIGNIDNSKKEQTYKFTDDLVNEVRKIALCKGNTAGESEIVQELHIHTYHWNEYNFLPIVIGTPTSERNGLVASIEFWDKYRDVYKQAITAPVHSHGVVNIKGQVTYLYTRARGAYPDSCLNGDINDIYDMYLEMAMKDSNMPKRAIFQFDLPYKRFWPLRKDDNNNIVICGNPDFNNKPYENQDYELVPIKAGCSIPTEIPIVNLNGSNNKLYMKGSQQSVAATQFSPKCYVMAESSSSSYIGEFRSDNTLATTFMNRGNGTAFVILPWRGEDTKWIALHELGHTMGLGDVRTDLPSTGDENSKSEEGSIMFYKMQVGYKLRQRNMEIGDTINASTNPPIGDENQWDCLQRRAQDRSCSRQDWLFK